MTDRAPLMYSRRRGQMFPKDPNMGAKVHVTDTDEIYMWTGVAWKQVTINKEERSIAFPALFAIAFLIMLMLLTGIELTQQILQWVDHCNQGGIGDGGAYCFHSGGNDG